MKNWSVETVARRAQAGILRRAFTTRPTGLGTRAHEYLSGQRDMDEIAEDLEVVRAVNKDHPAGGFIYVI
jgi:hypothetical protein